MHHDSSLCDCTINTLWFLLYHGSIQNGCTLPENQVDNICLLYFLVTALNSFGALINDDIKECFHIIPLIYQCWGTRWSLISGFIFMVAKAVGKEVKMQQSTTSHGEDSGVVVNLVLLKIEGVYWKWEIRIIRGVKWWCSHECWICNELMKRWVKYSTVHLSIL